MGSVRATAVSDGPLGPAVLAWRESRTIGVGSMLRRTRVCRLGRTGEPGFGCWWLPYWVAVGVGSRGKYPEPVALVRGADGGSGDAIPSHAVPARQEIRQDDVAKVSVSPGKQSWDVLQERVLWSHLADDADGVGPHVAGVVTCSAFAGGRERLAREACSDDIHEASPGPPVEGASVIPNGEWREASVALASEQHSGAVAVPFHGAHGAPSQEVRAKQSAPSSGK